MTQSTTLTNMLLGGRSHTQAILPIHNRDERKCTKFKAIIVAVIGLIIGCFMLALGLFKIVYAIYSLFKHRSSSKEDGRPYYS